MNHVLQTFSFQLCWEKRIIFKELRHYANLGNDETTPMPIVDPTTGEEVAIFDTTRLATFAQEHAAEFRDMMANLVPRLQRYTGGKLRELEGLAQVPAEGLTTAIKNCRERILEDLENLPFLARFVKEHREAGLKELGHRADEFIDQVIHQWMPHYMDQISLSNEVKGTNDAGELLIMAFNRSLDPRIRYEAKRKLILMELLGKMTPYTKEDMDRDDSMSRMNEWLNQRVLEPEVGEKTGAAQNRYLFSAHDTNGEDDHKTKDAKIVNNADLIKNPNQRLTPMSMRRLVVKRGGEIHEIQCMIDIRERQRLPFSRLIKKMQRNEPAEAHDHDYNGLRMVFEEVEDFYDFIHVLEKQIRASILAKVSEQVRSPEKREKAIQRFARLHECVKINFTSNNFDGETGANQMRMLEMTLDVEDEEDFRHHYEFQVFLPEGYADFLYRRKVSLEEHRASRFFDRGIEELSSPSELLFPVSIYKGLDHAAIAKQAKEEAYKRAWENGTIALKRDF